MFIINANINVTIPRIESIYSIESNVNVSASPMLEL